MSFIFFIFFPVLAFSQTRDFVATEFMHIPGQGETASGITIGLPPKMLGDLLWAQSLSRRETRIDDLDDFPDLNLRLREYSYAPIFITDLKMSWKMSVGTFVSFRMADREFFAHSKSTNLIGFVTFAPLENGQNRFKWFWGFFLPDRAFGVPFFPAAGFEYKTENERWDFVFRFPQILAQYKIYSGWDVGAFLRYQSSSFYLSDHKIFKPMAVYVENKSVSAGVMTRYQLPNGISGNCRVGYNLRNQTSILDSHYDKIRALNESTGVFLSIGLGIGFN